MAIGIDAWNDEPGQVFGTEPGFIDSGSFSGAGDSGSGINWGNISKALGALGQGSKDAQQPSQQTPLAAAVTGSAQSAGVGRPTSQFSLDTLVRLLNARRDNMFQSAVSGRAQPISGGQSSGLLGY